MLLLISGWLIAIAALVMLSELTKRYAFVGAGICVVILGLALLTQRYTAIERAKK